MTVTANTIVNLWFGDDLDTPKAVAERSRLWFVSDPAFDELIRSRFETLPDQVLNGDYADWVGAAIPTLALVLVLDQFPRNLYRGSSRSFAYDSAAIEIAREAIARGLDQALHPLHAVFLYFPFEHAEDQDLQDRCVCLFRQLVERAPRNWSTTSAHPWNTPNGTTQSSSSSVAFPTETPCSDGNRHRKRLSFSGSAATRSPDPAGCRRYRRQSRPPSPGLRSTRSMSRSTSERSS